VRQRRNQLTIENSFARGVTLTGCQRDIDTARRPRCSARESAKLDILLVEAPAIWHHQAGVGRPPAENLSVVQPWRLSDIVNNLAKTTDGMDGIIPDVKTRTFLFLGGLRF
jgi:hypothetical protein